MTLDQIKYANKQADGHYFDKDTMRFFRSRVSDRVHEGPGGVFFVTSEQHQMSWRNYQGPRLYTIRQALCGGANIKTVGQFQGHDSARKAHAEAARLASK